MTRWSWVWMGAVLLAVATAGCADRSHMTRSYGRAYAEAFTRQQANPKAGNQRAPQGLDSQEASIVAQGYRSSLAPKGTSVQSQPTLWVAPPGGPAGAAAALMPPPSVPQVR